MKVRKKLVIFGTGEIAKLAYSYFKYDSDFEVAAFTADDEFVKEDNFLGLPLVPASRVQAKYPPAEYLAHVALSYSKLNQIRRAKYDFMKKLGYELASYVCSKSVFWPDLSIGDNCFILENQTIQPTVKIGNNVMIWSGNHLGHGCRIEDHVYIASHVCISGHTVIGERTFVGVNATFKDFVNVGRRSFITMDASVVKDIPDDSVVLGASSTLLGPEDELGVKIKKMYFGL